jgi:hypothetical protein
MARTTDELVGSIVDVTEGVDLESYIDVANELVTEICGDAGYEDSRLVKIETWLAAHFYTVYDPRSTQEGAGPVSASYEGQAAMHLNRTRYGQQVLILDTAGGFAALQAQAAAGTAKIRPVVFWAGLKRGEE